MKLEKRFKKGELGINELNRAAENTIFSTHNIMMQKFGHHLFDKVLENKV